MTIHIQGASEHNLNNVDVTIDDGLTVVTGVSGSGKTSLVFDTLYHEARRRFVEIYSLGSANLRLSPARVESISGLGPAMAVGQNLLNRNPNSTLATASGLHPFFRLLYANFGERRCAKCDATLTVLTEDEIVAHLSAMNKQGPLLLRIPLVRGTQGSHQTLLELLVGEFGPNALRVDGQPWSSQSLAPVQPHDIDIDISPLDKETSIAEIRRAIQTMSALGAHALIVRNGTQEVTLTRAPVCPGCGNWFGVLEPVQFHTPCSHCDGVGCSQCGDTGLHPAAAAVRWSGLRLTELLAATVDDVYSRFTDDAGAGLPLPPATHRLQAEIERRLAALSRVGLGYLTLDRPAPSLSRGEAQRVRLAMALTSRLEDMLHILDEPTVGLHPADVTRLLPAFRELPGPVVYVEHDRVAAAAADHAIDLGPGAGQRGGRVVFSGSPAQLWESNTPTGHYFSLRNRVPLPTQRPVPTQFLTVHAASLRTLQEIDVRIPLGRLTVISGVSGSGKSTLVRDVLVASLTAGEPVGCQHIEGPSLQPMLVDQSPIGRNPRSNPATYTKLADILRDHFAAVTGLSPSHFSFNRPEGACPACKGMGAVEVRMRYLPSTWIPCAACGGRRYADEVLAARIEIGGRLLSIADFYSYPIADAMALLSEDERLTDENRRSIDRISAALHDVGLDYLPLGQPSPTLSGGEAQRVKLAKYLGRRLLTRNLLVLDEPSTGLHPQDLAGLLVVLDRLVRAGATVVVVEHNTDVIRAADWVIDLGPGAGAAGGQVMYAGPPDGLAADANSVTGQALRDETEVYPHVQHESRRVVRANSIAIRGACAHNLQSVDVDFPKGALTVVTGVSGSGKSSLVGDVLEAEAMRRYLETLSLYERQSISEGPEASVERVQGLGVALTVGPERRFYQRRATVGTATEMAHHLAILLATIGERSCLACGAKMVRVPVANGDLWRCSSCQSSAPVAQSRHFSPTNYAAACLTCSGVGSLQMPEPDKLIIRPERPLCDGAMHSPGFFPKGYLCKPYNGGYDMVQGLAARYAFDPFTTPWNEMTPAAQQAFLFGDTDPLPVTYRSRTGRVRNETIHFAGFYGWIRDWDVGGTYTRNEPCPDCRGGRLRPEYLAMMLNGYNYHQLSEMPLADLAATLQQVTVPTIAMPTNRENHGHAALHFAHASLRTVLHRLRFLCQIGLGYLHLNRVAATLSAGETQRVKLAGLLGSGLTALTVLLDEPSRGLHPTEVDALLGVLLALRDEGHTVIVVEHELTIIRAADYLVDMGPGAGTAGGQIVARGAPGQVAQASTSTARWLSNEHSGAQSVVQSQQPDRARHQPNGWLTIRGARANNLRGDDVRLPLGVLVGLCGVSGSGKSTLLIDTLGRALAPQKQTTSVAREPLDPGVHDAIEGTWPRTVVVDQTRAGVTNPADYLGISGALRRLYAASADAQALGLDSKDLTRNCSSCNGRGTIKTDMGFLPDIFAPCDTCRGTGYLPEAWEVRLQDVSLPELFSMTIDQVYDLFGAEGSVARPLIAARDVGLGYLVLRQPGHALSGGEAQRLKIAKELCRKSNGTTLYILDEPTVGQHMEDVMRLIGVLHRLVNAGHSVAVVEHHVHLLAACDWLIELGPGGGPDGGRIIAADTPDTLAAGETPIAPFLREVLEGL